MKRDIKKRVRISLYIFMLLAFTSFLIVPIAASGGDLPAGPDAQIGNPSITVDNKTMTIDAGQHDKTWIDWGGGFNIGVQNTVNNIGPSSAATMLHNDISGAISNIQGVLSGNLNVFLLNPNGILFSPTAHINVGGLVTSTLMMTHEDFLAGKYILRGDDLHSADILNAGTINASGVGGVTLIGGAVRNTGIIKADLGSVNLLAGGEVTLNIAGNGSIQAAVSKEILGNVYDQDGNRVTVGVDNLGTITSDGGKVYIETGAVKDIFDTLINQEGVVRAASLVERNGKIVLVSHSEGIVQNTGTLDASAIEAGADGGTIEMTGFKVGQFGEVHADAIDGDGGNIKLNADDTVALSSGSITTANAGINGNGGEIIVYSPDTALFRREAQIEAKGGSLAGDGGFVEVSGKEHVEVYGIVDASAPNGTGGLFFIDPAFNITIQAAAGTLDGLSPNFTAGADDSTVGEAAIEADLDAGTSVVIQTADGAVGDDTGTIIQNVQIDKSAGGASTITYNAADDIVLNGGIVSTSGTLSVVLNANGAFGTATGTGDVDINAVITTNGGTFTSTGVNLDNTGGIITTGNGTVSITHTGAVTIGAAINSGSGTFSSSGTTFSNTTDSTITTDNNTITITHTGAVTIGAAIDSGSGAAAITSSGAITGASGVAHIVAGATTLTANGSGAIGTAAARISLNVTSLTATATASGIYVTEADDITIGTVTSSGADNDVSIISGTGDITLGAITAAGATVTVDSSKNGNITDNNGAAVNVTAGGAVFSAKTGIGTGTDGIETTVGTISATTTGASAEIYIDETDALTSITAVTNNSDVDIDFVDGGAKKLSFVSGTGFLSLTAGANLDVSYSNTGGKIVQSGISVGTGDLTLTASTDITQSGGTAIVADEATLTAGTFIGVVATPILTTVNTLTAAASDGGVYVSETDAVTLTASAAGTTKDVVVSNLAGIMTINAVTSTNAVNLTAVGSLLDGNGATNNITATSSETTLVSGGSIGTLADPIETKVAGTISATSVTGVFLSNTGDVTQLDASASGAGDISFTNTGSVILGVVSAVGDTVTFDVSTGITDLADATTDIFADTLNVTADSFGATGNRIETDVSTMNSIVTSSGGIFIADLAGNLTITTITAGGAGSDVEFSSVGNIVLGAITAAGDDVVLSAVDITDGNAATVNVTAKTLDITATNVGVGDALEFAVSQITTTVSGTFNAIIAGPISITPASLAGKTTAVTLVADDVTILDNSGGTITMGVGGSLDLTAQYGNIVFLNTSDTINSNAGDITFTANYAGNPTGLPTANLLPGRIVASNLTSGGGNITLNAYSDITIGLLDATAGIVTVNSSNGLILDGNAAVNNIVAGIATLTAQMHTAANAELDRENVIAEYIAKASETDAKETTMDTWDTDHTTLNALMVDTQATKDTAQSTFDTTQASFDTESATLDTFEGIMLGLTIARTAAQIANDVASFPGALAQAIPLTGDGGADTILAGVALVFSIADAAVFAYDETTLGPQQDKVQGIQDELDIATSNLFSSINDLHIATEAKNGAFDALNIATAAFDAAVIARDHAEVIRAQGITSNDATNVIGTSSRLGVQAATINVTTTGGVAGTAALTLISANNLTFDAFGNIDIENAANADVTLTSVVTSNGDITYTQTGAFDTLIGVVTADTTDDTVNITSAGAIYDDVNDAVVDITGATINLTAAVGGIGQTNGTLDINATVALNADTAAGDDANITIEDRTGDLPVGVITAGAGTVALTSAANITDTNAATGITAAGLVLTALSGNVGAPGANNQLDTDVDTITAAVSGNIYILENNAVALPSIVTTAGLIDIEAGGSITTTTITAGGSNGVNLYAAAGNIFDTSGGLISAGAQSTLRASGIIGTAVAPHNPLDVNINGDLWVWAGSLQNEVSVILDGVVASTASTERLEIFGPTPPGLVMLNNYLMGGGNYGSGSNRGSLLSRGYGETVITRTDMFDLYSDRVQQPTVIDNEFLNGRAVTIDGSPLGIDVLPPRLIITPEPTRPTHYYVIRKDA